MRNRASLAVAALGILAIALPMGASGAPQTTLGDIEDEVMCPICGTLLELSEAPQAERQRAYVRGLIADGRTKAEIKDALVTQYGREVLALPQGSGFDLSAYLVPVIGFFAAIAALALGIGRWRRSAKRPPPRTTTPGPEGEQAAQLEADISRYDL